MSKIRIGIINFNSGNIFSLSNILENLSCTVEMVDKNSNTKDFDKIIIPGVGSYYEAMKYIKSSKIDNFLNEFALEKTKPVLGICIGMQIMTKNGHEGRVTQGLNFIGGECSKMENTKFSLPHIGWNNVSNNLKKNSKIFYEIDNNNDFYFAHSYCVKNINSNYITGITNYENNFISSIQKDNIYGTQFHPEKSSKVGYKILKNFISL